MWALESIATNKASGGDGIPVELFQILKDDAMKALDMPANLENSAVATGLENVSFHSNRKETRCQRMHKLPRNCTHLTRWQIMPQILQARLQQHANFQMFKSNLEKPEEPEIKLPTSAGSWKKQESSRKTSISALLTTPSL